MYLLPRGIAVLLTYYFLKHLIIAYAPPHRRRTDGVDRR